MRFHSRPHYLDVILNLEFNEKKWLSFGSCDDFQYYFTENDGLKKSVLKKRQDLLDLLILQTLASFADSE
jgi:hypothetical protein